MIKIGLIQASAAQNILENIKVIEKYVKEAKERDCSIVCFPECFLTGYYPEEALSLAVERENTVLNKISLMAKRNKMDLLIGFMEADADKRYITHGIFNANGDCQYYRKTHLGEKEEKYFVQGDVLEVFTLSCGIKAGFQICVETHFPEITKTLSLRGAEVVFAPHAVPSVAGCRKSIWSKIIPARSYDNRVYMTCCNLWDEAKFGGGCLVTAPNGDVIAEMYEETAGLLAAEINLEEVRRYRQENSGKRYRYYPSKARKELYL